MKRMMTLGVVACVMLVSACGQDAAGGTPDDPEPLTVALPAPNAIYWAIYAGIEHGWFEEEGFEAEVVSAQGSAGALQQVASDSAQIAGGTPDAVVNAVAGGSDIDMLSVALNESALTLIGQPEVTDYSDLEGQTIGVSAIAGGEIGLLQLLLEQNGLDEDDYDVVVSGTTPSKVSALESNSVAAAVLFSPADFTLEGDGYNRLGSTIDVPIASQMPLAAYSVRESWLAEGDRSERLQRALETANDWLRDPANKEDAISVFVDAADAPEEDVRATYELWFEENDLWPEGPGLVTEDHVAATLEMMDANDELDDGRPEISELFVGSD